MTKIVGLTGGIGSGKTTVAKMFENLGVPIYIADLEAKVITNQPKTLKLIEKQFGSTVIENGKLNRTAVAQIVFNNPEKLKQLNSIIHPLVAEHFKEWINKNKDQIFVIKETAILFETNSHLSCDFVITVSAPIDTRINRVQIRDNSPKEEIMKRINNQWSDEQRIPLSDFVINNITVDDTLLQVKEIFQKIVNFSK